MIRISHRGNISGPNPKLENKPSYIESALNDKYAVEIDVWFDKHFYLGHDKPRYKITYNWLINKWHLLWIHCKNRESFEKMTISYKKTDMYLLNYFWHQTDDYTLTSKGYIWTYTGIVAPKYGIRVLPKETEKIPICAGICSDNIERWENKLI